MTHSKEYNESMHNNINCIKYYFCKNINMNNATNRRIHKYIKITDNKMIKL